MKKTNLMKLLTIIMLTFQTFLFGQNKIIRQLKESNEMQDYNKSAKLIYKYNNKSNNNNLDFTIAMADYYAIEGGEKYNPIYSLRLISKINCIDIINNDFIYFENTSECEKILSQRKEIYSTKALKELLTMNSIDTFQTYKYLFDIEKQKTINNKIIEINFKIISERNDKEMLLAFIRNNEFSKFKLDAEKLIEKIEYDETYNSEDKNKLSFFIKKYPRSEYIDTVVRKLELLQWLEIQSNPSLEYLAQYIYKCQKCAYRIDADELYSKIIWDTTNKKSILEVTNFVNKFPLSSKFQEATQLLSELQMKQNIDFENYWSRKLTIYKNSKNQFSRTNIVANSMDLEDYYINYSRYIEDGMFNVTEIIVGNAEDIIYQIPSKDSKDGSYKKIAVNDKTKYGYVLDDYFNQKLAKQQLILKKKNSLFDARIKKHFPVSGIIDNFEFESLSQFPYIRLSSNEAWNLTQRTPSYYNSEILFSISDLKLKAIQLPIYRHQFEKELYFGTSTKYFSVLTGPWNNGYKIYDKLNMREVLQITNDNNEDFRKILTFNDSVAIILQGNENTLDASIFIEIINLQTLKTKKIKLKENGIDIKFCTIDAFNKYLYVEYVYYEFSQKKIKLAVFDMEFLILVYEGRAIGINNTTEKLGWIMTKAKWVDLGRNFQAPLNSNNPEIYSIDGWKTSYESGYYTKVLERCLINLNKYFNLNFSKDLDSLVQRLSPLETFFNVELVKSRKQFLRDSLIAVSYKWNLNQNEQTSFCFLEEDFYIRNLQNKNIPTFLPDSLENSFNGKIDTTGKLVIFEPVKFEVINPFSFTIDNTFFEIGFLPKLISLTKTNSGFEFKFKVDSIPKYFEHLNPLFKWSKKYADWGHDQLWTQNYGINYISYNGRAFIPNQVGRQTDIKYGITNLKENPIVSIDDNLSSFSFEIVIENESIAEKFNEFYSQGRMKLNYHMMFSYNSTYNKYFMDYIKKGFYDSNLSTDHYMIDWINEVELKGIGKYKESLTLDVSDLDNEWFIPLYLSKEN